MSVPDQPAPIRLAADIWQLDAKPGHLEDSARAWRTMGEKSVDCGDRLVDATRTLLGSEWAGPARDSFAAHQSALVSTLDNAQGEAGNVATTLDRWAGLLRRCQSTLDGEFEDITRRVRTDNGRTPVAGEEVVFRPESPEQVNAVNAAVERARGIKAELESVLAEELLNFDNGQWAALAGKWLEVAEGTRQPFTMPPEADGTSVLMVDGRAIVNTGTGDDDVRVTVDPETGEVIVTVNGTEHRYPPGTPVTVRGGEGNDTIDIPQGANVRVTLLGGAGSDIIQGGDGNEVIIGGAGRDEIFGGAGRDYASGGAGDDYIDGQGGGDRIGGGLGRDVLYGLSGRDRLSGGEGDDYLEGGDHRDQLQGGSGQDVLSGGRGRDSMSGGTGNDAMYGGQGRDSISGGGGTDTAYRQDNDSVSRVTEDVRVEISGDYGFIEIDGSPEFQARILADLEMYRSSPTGQQMLQELADSRDPNWGPGENHLTIREFDEDNGEADSDPEFSGHDNSVVSINPTYTLDADGYAPPSIVLYHELGHIYDHWNDTRSGDTHEGGPDDGVNEAERQATGLPIDHDDDIFGPTPSIIDPDHPYVYTENAMRDEMGLPSRDTYASDGR